MSDGSSRIGSVPAEDMFRLLVEGAKDYAIFLLDPDGVVASWNFGAERIKGYSATEAVGRHFSFLYPAELAGDDLPTRHLAAARVDGRAEDEGWRVRKDSTRFWASVVITALRQSDGELLGFSKIARDLSERKAAEEAVRANERRFRLLAENARDVIFRFEYAPATRYEYVSPAIRELTGYSPEELYADPAVGLQLIHSDDRPVIADLMGGGMSKEAWIEVRFVSRAGRTVWTEQRVIPIWDHAGRLAAAEGVIRDITERKRAEEELRTAKAAAELALAQVRTLSGLIPICCYCKRVRDDQEYWHQVEAYVSEHTGVQFSHGICPSCYSSVVQPQLDVIEKPTG